MKKAHHSLANLAGCLLHLGHRPGRLFEDGMLYDVAKDGTEGYISNRRHPWRPAEATISIFCNDSEIKRHIACLWPSDRTLMPIHGRIVSHDKSAIGRKPCLGVTMRKMKRCEVFLYRRAYA